MARSLADKTLFITGASRGIGLAIAKRAAADGANIAIAAKTDQPHPKLPGTIHDAAAEIEAAGGRALPIVCDVRDEASVAAAVAKTVETFGGIDALVSNASAISLTPTLKTDMKRFDLMMSVNARGTFVVAKACLPHLLKSDTPHILILSPPLDFRALWFKNHAAYSLAKFGMSVFALGWAEEFKGKVAVNALWPRTTIDTAAVRNLLGGETLAARSRKPEILADAAHAILTKPTDFSGWFCLDDLVLAAEGVTDFERYAVTPGVEPALDFFLPEDCPAPAEANGRIGWRAPMLTAEAP